MSSGIRGILAQEIANKRTRVYENKGTEVYALRKMNRATLKEEVELRVISPEGRVSSMYNVTMLDDMDPARVFKDLIGCSGLTHTDIKKLSKNIQIKHDEIKMRVSEDAGLEDVLGLVYEILEDQMKTLKEVEETDPNMDKSIVLKDGYYMCKAAVFKKAVEDLDVNVLDLRREMVSIGLIEVASDREAASVSIAGKKQKLIRVKRGLMKRIFESADIEEEVIG